MFVTYKRLEIIMNGKFYFYVVNNNNEYCILGTRNGFGRNTDCAWESEFFPSSKYYFQWLNMGRRREKERQSKKNKNEGSSNPPIQQPQRNICSHCGQIIDARRLKFDVHQDSGVSTWSRAVHVYLTHLMSHCIGRWPDPFTKKGSTMILSSIYR